MNPVKTLIASACIFFGSISPSIADQHVPALTELAKNSLSQWVNSPIVIEQVNAQNSQTGDMSEADILILDKQWRAESGASSQPLIAKVLANPLSAYLKQVKEDSQGLYTEIFVMDAKGMNVGQSDVTTDYWQGDEDKWQKTFLEGSQAIHIGEVELDESSQQFQSQLSIPVMDPASGKVIGAITIGINLDAL